MVFVMIYGLVTHTYHIESYVVVLKIDDLHDSF